MGIRTAGFEQRFGRGEDSRRSGAGVCLRGGFAALAHDGGRDGHGDHARKGHGKGEHGKGGHGKRHHGDQHRGGGEGRDNDNEGNDNGGDHGNRCDCGDRGYSAWDEEWLKMSIEGDLFEIAGGNLAQERGVNELVLQLGARLVEDHTKSLQDAAKVAEELGIEVPQEPSPTQQWQLRALQTFSGNEFDRWYSDLEVQDHKQDIQEAQDEVEKGCNDQIRGLAEEDLPVLQQHLQLAQQALEASGGQPQARSRKHSSRPGVRVATTGNCDPCRHSSSPRRIPRSSARSPCRSRCPARSWSASGRRGRAIPTFT